MDESKSRSAQRFDSPRDPNSVRDGGGVHRRSVITAAAWSVPVIAATAAAPAYAASATCPPPTTLTATSANVTGGPTATLLVAIPPNVTQINYVVIGGSGGGWGGTGGLGATITGSIPIAALGGMTSVLLTAGGPGQGRDGFSNPGHLGNAGLGYGNGGQGLGSVGSGGGGSAITFPDGTPLVVAGGGGGGYNGNWIIRPTDHTDITDNVTAPDGGKARATLPGHAAERGYGWSITDTTVVGGLVATGVGAEGANSATPGQPGTTSPVQPGVTTAAGSPGTSPTSTTGGNGGNGAPLALTPMPNNWASGGGGGGGGYAGGAGGNSVAYQNPSNSMFADVSPSGSGGSSYVAAGITFTTAYTTVSDDPGSVTLTYTC